MSKAGDILRKAGNFFNPDTWMTGSWAEYSFHDFKDAKAFHKQAVKVGVLHASSKLRHHESGDDSSYLFLLDEEQTRAAGKAQLGQPKRACALGAIQYHAAAMGYTQEEAQAATKRLAETLDTDEWNENYDEVVYTWNDDGFTEFGSIERMFEKAADAEDGVS